MVVKVDPRRVVTQTDFVHLARRRFLKGDRLDIAGLAAELGVSRATAYRWAGNVEELTGQVIRTLVEDTFELTKREAEGEGSARIVDMLRRGMRYISSGPYRAWITREDPERALRLVATKHGPVQAVTMRLWEELLTEEVAKGNVRLHTDPHTTAYAIVRISESFLYSDLIVGEEPDIEKAADILKLLVN
jgi:AcrR family transcriptional regulator